MATATPSLPAGAGRQARDTLLVLLGLIVLWQLLHWLAGSVALASPWASVVRLGELLGRASFYPNLAETALAFGQALVISLLGGLAIGVALGANRLAGAVADPILVALYSIPKVTLYPLILLFFGLGMEAKVAFGAIHGIIPVIIFTMNAVRHIRPVYLRSARVMRLGPLETARTILVPACIPEIVSGFRIGFALTILGTLIGELFASQRGLGFLLMKAMHSNDTPTILAIALLLFAFASLCSWGLLALDRRLHRRT